MRQGSHVLFLDYCVPEPEKNSGSVRALELLRMLVDLGFAVSIQPEKTVILAKDIVRLLADGIHVVPPGSLKAMVEERQASERAMAKQGVKVDASLRKSLCPWDAIVISRRLVFTSQMPHVSMLCPNVPLIYDTLDLHHVRERRSFELALKLGDHTPMPIGDNYMDPLGKPKAAIDKLLEDSAKVEIGYLNRSDYIFVVAAPEKEKINKLLPKAQVGVLSNVYEDPDTKGSVPHGKRAGGLFVGNMCHTPNIDASKFILRSILANQTWFDNGFMHLVWSDATQCPTLMGTLMEDARRNPLVKLHLDISNQELEALHRQVKFFLGALRVGAGVKGKINMALLYGLPVIASTMAVEGMFMEDGKSFLAAEQAHEFRAQVARISKDAALWGTLQRNGWEVMRNHFSRTVARQTLQQVLSNLNVRPRISGRGANRRAVKTFKCPFHKELSTRGNRTAKSCGECWPCELNPYYLAPPVQKYSDGLLLDAYPVPKIGNQQAQGQGQQAKCPINVLPAKQNPFVFFHICKVGGMSLRRIFHRGAKRKNIHAEIPCHNKTHCQCAILWDSKGETGNCNTPEFKQASIYAGHFSPLPLDKWVHQQPNPAMTCFVMIRPPLDRALSHYNHFELFKQFGNRRFEQLPLKDMKEAIKYTGGGQYMTDFMTCLDRKSCDGKPPGHNKQEALRLLSRCHVGIQDNFNATLAYLAVWLPWAPDLSEMRQFHELKKQHLGGDQLFAALPKESQAEVKKIYQVDLAFYDKGQALFDSQVKHAIRCDGGKVAGNEPLEESLQRLETIANKVQRQDWKKRLEFAQCVEKGRLCREDVHQKTCGCSR